MEKYSFTMYSKTRTDFIPAGILSRYSSWQVLLYNTFWSVTLERVHMGIANMEDGEVVSGHETISRLG